MTSRGAAGAAPAASAGRTAVRAAAAARAARRPGGAAYVAGGTVTGSGDAFLSDAAVGGSGGYGGLGGLGGTAFGLGAGGHGGVAGSGNGGGLFVGAGSVSLGSTPFNHDLARGGNGGTGGLGGLSFSPSFSSSFSTFFSVPFSGRGGRAGAAGNADGGAVYVRGGSLTLGASGAATTNLQDDRALGGYHGSTGRARVRVGHRRHQRGRREHQGPARRPGPADLDRRSGSSWPRQQCVQYERGARRRDRYRLRRRHLRRRRIGHALRPEHLPQPGELRRGDL